MEKWELLTTQPNGQSVRQLQWYDPSLQLAIREELPGGLVRELRDIKEGSQPDSLFQVPEGYTETPMPSGQEQQRPSPQQ